MTALIVTAGVLLTVLSFGYDMAHGTSYALRSGVLLVLVVTARAWKDR